MRGFRGWAVGASCIAVAGSLAVATAGCGDDDSTPAPRVAITDDGYSPEKLTVAAGTRVTFVNRSPQNPHSAKDDDGGAIEVSPQPGPTKHDGSEINRATRQGFATHSLFPHEAQKVDFPVAGRYVYHCAFHPDMTATIEVTD